MSVEEDRPEGHGSVNSMSSDIPFLTEDMIDAAMNKHLNYQVIHILELTSALYMGKCYCPVSICNVLYFFFI